MNTRRYLKVCLLAALILSPVSYATEKKAQKQPDVGKQASPRELSWEELMPPVDEDIVKRFNDGKLSREEAMEYVKELGKTPIKALNNQWVEIPGYLVPLSLDADQKAKELLLVPTLGACIHVPPPPPNQTIYVRYDKGIKVSEAGYTPYTLKGTLMVESSSSEFTESAYTLRVDSIKVWD